MAAKNSNVWLVPDADSDAGVLPAPPSGAGMTRAEKSTVEKFRANSAEEVLKGIETIQAEHIVNGINRASISNGVDMIEFGYALSREGARDAAEQQTIDTYLGKVVPQALQDGRTTAAIGIRDIQNTLRRPLTADPKKWWQ